MAEETKNGYLGTASLSPNVKMGKKYYSQADIYKRESDSELGIEAIVGLARFPLFRVLKSQINFMEAYENYLYSMNKRKDINGSICIEFSGSRLVLR